MWCGEVCGLMSVPLAMESAKKFRKSGNNVIMSLQLLAYGTLNTVVFNNNNKVQSLPTLATSVMMANRAVLLTTLLKEKTGCSGPILLACG